MPSSKRTRIQSKKKKRRFLMTSKKCWIIEDKLIPLYSHLLDHYSNQLLEDPFCCEIIEIKQEYQEDYLLESLTSSADQHDSSNHLEKVDCCIYYSHFEFTWGVTQLLTTQRQNLNYVKQTCFLEHEISWASMKITIRCR